MPKAFKRTASARVRPQNRYGGVAKLAADLSGRTIWTVYKVLRGVGVSAPVSLAIAEARARLAAKPKRGAAA